MQSWDGHISPHEAMPRAKAAALNALKLDDTLAQAHLSLGLTQMTYDFDWQSAEQSFDRAIELNPAEEMGYFWAVVLRVVTSRFEEVTDRVTQAMQGKHAQATAELEQSVTGSGRMIRVLSALGCAYARAGNPTAAQAVLAELEARAETEYVQACYFAVIYAALGQAEQAFAWLQKAYEDRNGFLMYANVEPAFDFLRHDPRFAALLQRLGLATAA